MSLSSQDGRVVHGQSVDVVVTVAEDDQLECKERMAVLVRYSTSTHSINADQRVCLFLL